MNTSTVTTSRELEIAEGVEAVELMAVVPVGPAEVAAIEL